MQDWQVLVLSGPPGAGKSSVAQALCREVPGSVHVPVWISKMTRTAEDAHKAREEILATVRLQLADGNRVVVDDAIESPSELAQYEEALPNVTLKAVTLMPSLDEMARRDALRPVELQMGRRVEEAHALMVRALGRCSVVLDTSHDTTPDTVRRILDALA